MKLVVIFVQIRENMASTETQTLKIIWKNKGEASLLKIAKELKISTDYGRLICRDLIKDKFIEFFEGEYKITDLGREELEKFGLHLPAISIEKAEKKVKPKKPKELKELKRPKRKIVAEREVKEETTIKVKGTPITELSNLAPELSEELCQKGFKTLEDIATTNISRLEETIEGLKLQKAAEMINEARAKLKKQGKEYLWAS